MAPLGWLNDYEAFCDNEFCEALEDLFQSEAHAEHELYCIQVGQLSLHDCAGGEAEAEADERFGAQADAFYAALLDKESMEETEDDRRIEALLDALLATPHRA